MAAALDWPNGSLSNKICEGSATSDEDHPRCSGLSKALLECFSTLVLQPRWLFDSAVL
jgi:hypothetical protein